MTSNLPTLALDGARPVLVHYTDRSGALMLRPGSLSGLGTLARSWRCWRLSPANFKRGIYDQIIGAYFLI